MSSVFFQKFSFISLLADQFKYPIYIKKIAKDDCFSGLDRTFKGQKIVGQV